MHALSLTGIDLVWDPLGDVGGSGRLPAPISIGAPVALRALRRPPDKSDVAVLHAVPATWKVIAERRPARRLIGHVVWEADELPRRWIAAMDGVDEFWVPTEWNRQALSSAFDKPVHVVPHILESVPSEPPPIGIPADQRVVAIVSAWDWRKRPDRTLHAALRAFEGRDDVTIVVKTGPRTLAWRGAEASPFEQITRLTARFPRGPHVIADWSNWTDAQMLGLLERADCVFSLTAVEGWGLGPFDAAGVGTPVVITGYGGQLEWMGADHPGLVPYRMVPNDHPDKELFEPGVRWAEPDIDAGIDLLRGVIDGTSPDVTARSSSLKDELRDRYSPISVAQILVDALPDEVLDRAVEKLTAAQSPRPRARARSLLVLTPVKNAARHAAGWVDRVLSLQHSCDRLEAAVLVSDSTDGTVEAFRQEMKRLDDAGIATAIVEHDYDYQIPGGLPRWSPQVQFDRRRILAKSRNRLLMSTLRDHEWVLWIDSDVVWFPEDIVSTMLETGADIVHPNCTHEPGGRSFDLNAWTDRGRYHLDDYRGHGQVELHAVGGTMLLVRADCHRDGLIWPAFPYGVPDPRARVTPAEYDRLMVGELETEGLGLVAGAMGYTCIGLPDVEIHHEP